MTAYWRIDMRCAHPAILVVMAVDVRVRVPNDVYRALLARAGQLGQSLAEFLGAELTKVAGSVPRTAESVSDVVPPSGV
jgi:hypothetical protein